TSHCHPPLHYPHSFPTRRSSDLHIGHMLPWFFAKWLQEKFRATMYFQITDDEKFLFKDFDKLEDATKVGYDNILDIIAMGFDPRSEEHTSELQSRFDLVCRLLLE